MREEHEKGFTQGNSPKIDWTESLLCELSERELKYLTGEMPHLRIFPRPRLGQDLTRRDSLQVFSYMFSVCALTAMCGGCWAWWGRLSESYRGAR